MMCNNSEDEQKRREKISKTLKGHKVSEETREKLRQANLGKKTSLRTKIKQSQSLKNRQMTDSWKGKISQSHLSEKNPNWQNGRSSEEDKLRGRREAVTWSNLVRTRDSYTCQICKKKVYGRRCHAHHIKSWSEYPELRYDVNNGVTLCRSCHRQIHRKS